MVVTVVDARFESTRHRTVPCGVRLVVIDSVAFHFRQDFRDMALRTTILAKMTNRLMSLATDAGLAVVTVNQVTVKPDPGGGGARLVPALGERQGVGQGDTPTSTNLAGCARAPTALHARWVVTTAIPSRAHTRHSSMELLITCAHSSLVRWSIALLITCAHSSLVHWSIALLITCAHSSLVHWSIALLTTCAHSSLVHWSIALLITCAHSSLVHWSIGPLVHWSIGPLVHWSIGPLVHCTADHARFRVRGVRI